MGGVSAQQFERDVQTSADGGKDGILYRFDPSGEVIIFRGEIGISNTLDWSPDRSRFYFGDSLANVIWAYDYDLETSLSVTILHSYGTFL